MDGAWPVFVSVHSWEHAMGRRQLSLQPRDPFGGLSLLFLLVLFAVAKSASPVVLLDFAALRLRC
jgi:hypothetical protein